MSLAWSASQPDNRDTATSCHSVHNHTDNGDTATSCRCISRLSNTEAKSYRASAHIACQQIWIRCNRLACGRLRTWLGYWICSDAVELVCSAALNKAIRLHSTGVGCSRMLSVGCTQTAADITELFQPILPRFGWQQWNGRGHVWLRCHAGTMSSLQCILQCEYHLSAMHTAMWVSSKLDDTHIAVCIADSTLCQHDKSSRKKNPSSIKTPRTKHSIKNALHCAISQPKVWGWTVQPQALSIASKATQMERWWWSSERYRAPRLLVRSHPSDAAEAGGRSRARQGRLNKKRSLRLLQKKSLVACWLGQHAVSCEIASRRSLDLCGRFSRLPTRAAWPTLPTSPHGACQQLCCKSCNRSTARPQQRSSSMGKRRLTECRFLGDNATWGLAPQTSLGIASNILGDNATWGLAPQTSRSIASSNRSDAVRVGITKKLLPPEIVQLVANNRHGNVWFHRGLLFVQREIEAPLNQTLTQSKHRKPRVSGWTAQPQTLGTDSQGTQMAQLILKIRCENCLCVTRTSALTWATRPNPLADPGLRRADRRGCCKKKDWLHVDWVSMLSHVK